MKSTPGTDQGRASVRRILDAACDLFYRQGVRATGLNQLADASGSGKGQLYHYFQDKDDLVSAVIAEQVHRAISLEETHLTAMTTISDLRDWIEHLVNRFERRDGLARCPLGALVSELAGENPVFRAALNEGFLRWRAAIAGGLKRIMASGELAPDADPDAMAEVLLAAYEGGVLLSEVHGNTKALRLAMHASMEWIISSAAVAS